MAKAVSELVPKQPSDRPAELTQWPTSVQPGWETVKQPAVWFAVTNETKRNKTKFYMAR